MIGPIWVGVLVTGLLVLAAWSLGRMVVRHTPEHFSLADAWALRLLVGAGLLGVGGFAVGQLHFSIALVALLLGASVLTLWWRGPARRLPLVRPRWSAPGEWALIVAALVLLVLALSSLAEPVGTMEHDGISYHLLGPKVWLREGRIVPVLDHCCTSYPPLVETLFGFALALGSDRAPGLLGVFFAAVMLLQVWGLGRRLGAQRAGASLAVALVATMPVAIGTSDLYFVDVPFACFALLCARLSFDAAGRREVILAGLCGGFALATKYTGVPLLAITCAVALVARVRERRLRGALGDVLLIGAVALLVGSPAYLRNVLVLGNPLYPHYFGGVAFPPESVAAVREHILERGRGLGAGVLDLLLLPWRFTFETAFFHGAGGIGLGPLGLAPLGIYHGRAIPKVLPWCLWMALLVLAWFVTQQEARFLLHVLLVLGAFAGVAAGVLLQQPSRIARILPLLAVLLSFGYGGSYLIKARAQALRSLVSSAAAQERRAAHVPFRDAMAFINGAQGVGRVLVAHVEIPPYFLEKAYLKLNGPYGEYPVDGLRNFEDVLPRLGALGVTHVLDAKTPTLDFRVAPHPSLEPLFESPTARVYRVR